MNISGEAGEVTLATWEVRGAHRLTGEDASVVVEADSEAGASAAARAIDVLAESVARVESTSAAAVPTSSAEILCESAKLLSSRAGIVELFGLMIVVIGIIGLIISLVVFIGAQAQKPVSDYNIAAALAAGVGSILVMGVGVTMWGLGAIMEGICDLIYK